MLRSPLKLFFQTLCQQNKCLRHWRWGEAGVCVQANSQEHGDKISWPACSPGKFRERLLARRLAGKPSGVTSCGRSTSFAGKWGLTSFQLGSAVSL